MANSRLDAGSLRHVSHDLRAQYEMRTGPWLFVFAAWLERFAVGRVLSVLRSQARRTHRGHLLFPAQCRVR